MSSWTVTQREPLPYSISHRIRYTMYTFVNGLYDGYSVRCVCYSYYFECFVSLYGQVYMGSICSHRTNNTHSKEQTVPDFIDSIVCVYRVWSFFRISWELDKPNSEWNRLQCAHQALVTIWKRLWSVTIEYVRTKE